MKRLYILRHAKSSWSNASLSDFERPLNERGRAAAPFMGELIAKRNLMPELIICSPAARAVETADLLRSSAGIDAPVILDDRIYEASPQTLKTVIAGLSVDTDSALLVGHNPGIEGLIENLTGRIERMPTAALALVDLDIGEWSGLHHGLGHLIAILRPKDLMRSAE